MQAARGVLERLLPAHANEFVLKQIAQEDGRDRFEIESVDGKIVLRGTDGVTTCFALNWYLKYYCNAHVSWCGNQLDIPSPLPAPEACFSRTSPYKYRYAFNFCTFGYAMAYWSWERWERELDYMAFNGINLPLSITGAESVTREVYRELGVSDTDIGKFISGPPYLPFFFMGCLDGWGGPLSDAWYKKQTALQKKILERARSLGMKPILPAFTGHVPAAITTKFPDAKIQRMKSWGGFPGTYVLDASDPLFARIGHLTLEKTIEMYGTDHYYASDTFIEMHPPSLELDYLKGISREIYKSMLDVDPKATWVMQGWLFNNSETWTQPRIDALLSGTPDDRMIILDLWATAKPHWTHTKAFGGKQWIWCQVHNWGGKQGMYGRMQRVGTNLPNALNHPESGNLVGIGTTNEGSEINPLVFDQMYEMAWHNKPLDLHRWVEGYARRRYGKSIPAVTQAWKILIDTVYSCNNDHQRGPIGSFLTMRPSLSPRGGSFVRADIFYNIYEVQAAFTLLLSAADELWDEETYRYDIADLARQVMSDLSQKELHPKLRAAKSAEDVEAFKEQASIYLQAINDVDELLLSQSLFLAGRWIGMARDKAAGNQEERNLYERNARNIITTWGDKNNLLHDYAQRQYGGMMGDFNYTRWKIYLDTVVAQLMGKKVSSAETRIRQYEERWVYSQNDYPRQPIGDTLAIARKIQDKYINLEKINNVLASRKPPNPKDAAPFIGR